MDAFFDFSALSSAALVDQALIDEQILNFDFSSVTPDCIEELLVDDRMLNLDFSMAPDADVADGSLPDTIIDFEVDSSVNNDAAIDSSPDDIVLNFNFDSYMATDLVSDSLPENMTNFEFDFEMPSNVDFGATQTGLDSFDFAMDNDFAFDSGYSSAGISNAGLDFGFSQEDLNSFDWSSFDNAALDTSLSNASASNASIYNFLVADTASASFAPLPQFDFTNTSSFVAPVPPMSNFTDQVFENVEAETNTRSSRTGSKRKALGEVSSNIGEVPSKRRKYTRSKPIVLSDDSSDEDENYVPSSDDDVEYVRYRSTKARHTTTSKSKSEKKEATIESLEDDIKALRKTQLKLYAETDKANAAIQAAKTRAKNAKAAKEAARVKLAKKTARATRKITEKTRSVKVAQTLTDTLSVLAEARYPDIELLSVETWIARGISARISELGDRKAKSVGKIPRPLNAFMMYRKVYHPIAKAWLRSRGTDSQQTVSEVTAASWAMESYAVKDVFKAYYDMDVKEHKLAFPGYEFRVALPSKKKAALVVSNASSSELSGLESDGDDSDY